MDFKILSQEDIPCWYEISFDDKRKRLLFSLHEDYLNHVDVEIREDNWFIKKRLEETKFTHFARDFTSDFGFEDCMKNEGVKDKFRVLSVDVPQIKYFTDKECEMCDGSGENKFISSNKCSWCQGSGKEIEIRWEKMDAIACTIEFLMKYMYFGIKNDKTTSSEKKQLLSLNTMYEKGLDGSSLGGEISPCLAAWLETLGKEYQFEKAVKHMKYAEHKMFGINMNDLGMHHFDAIVRGENRLCIGVAGDRTCIHPVDWGYEKGRGYEFSSHNVDTSAQQLELIIGLASVCDKYREQMIGEIK